MKTRIFLFIIVMIFSLPVQMNSMADDTAADVIMDIMQDKEDYEDLQLKDILESKSSEFLLLSDKSLGFLRTYNGKSYYVDRVVDNDEMQMKFIDIKTGKELFSTPYIEVSDYSIITDPVTKEPYYKLVLENGYTITIPVWINDSNYDNISIVDEFGNPINVSVSPVFFDGGYVIGSNIFLTNDIKLVFKNPIYGTNEIEISSGEQEKFDFSKYFEKPKIKLSLSILIEGEDDDEEEEKKEKDEKSDE